MEPLEECRQTFDQLKRAFRPFDNISNELNADLTPKERFNKLEEISLTRIYSKKRTEVGASHPNRYDCGHPYDDHRATVDREYLNCSPICFEDETVYAAEAPTEKSLQIFLKFLTQPLPESKEGIQIVVCLTMPIEKEKDKCLEYWLGSNIEIIRHRVIKEMGDQSATETSLKLPGGKIIRLFRYLNWPDGHRCKKHLLYALIRRVSKYKSQSKLFHCSLGAGRTGTALAAYRIFNNQNINLDREILWMRLQRWGIVRSDGQYKMLVEFINYIKKCKDEHASSTPENTLRKTTARV
jgi:protein tyrosine phosphatase